MGANKDKPMGGLHPYGGLRNSRRYPSSTLGETQGSGVGTERPPELGREGGSHFNFCPATSATDG
ncbi:hypothetical protein NQZ68_015002 [Dissostichus eleginoides]|nr:hypothetical protein NQZ68_015002 [Dissostichus eleginoides]